MKAIRMFHRRINFNSTSTQRTKCESSLAHTLRLSQPKEKGEQWRDALADENIIYLNDEYHKLSDFADDEKQILAYEIGPALRIAKQTKHQDIRRKYKLKIKDAACSLEKKGNKEAAQFMRDIHAYSDDKHIPYSKLDKFEKLDSTRKRQRIKTLGKYIESHNLLASKVPNANAVYVQEGIFKIPLKWGITTDIISKKSYIDVVKDFLTKHFCDYDIKCIVCHHDERELDEDVGAHSHYFLSGKNNVTGLYDLHKTQVSVVNQYIKRKGEKGDVLPDDSNLNLKQTKIFGEYFQRMFYEHINEYLLNPLGLVATFADETEKKSERRKQMNREVKLPKFMRSSSMAQRSRELAEKRLIALQSKIKDEEARFNDIELSVEQHKSVLKSKVEQLNEAKTLIEYFSDRATSSSDTLKALEERHAFLEKEVTVIDNQAANAVADICRKIYSVSALRDTGLDAKAQEFIAQILTEFAALEPSLLNNLCCAAAKAINEESLISELTIPEDFDGLSK